jgi:curli production assembly/transport component CsgG/holdfast attachment protein HfaB
MCLAHEAQGRPAPRIAVGRILDYTGTVSDDGGRRITQGGSLMAMSAFAKAGAHLVERFDTSVSELELRYANSRLIGQNAAPGASDVRTIMAGQVAGSDYYFVGGITELNYNIRSIGADATVGHSDARDGVGTLGGRLYVMNIGLDFRLIDTRTLEVVQVVSYQKQIVGRELRAGVFSFFGDTMVDLSVGERALEPIQLAVRAGVERAVLEVMGNIQHVDVAHDCSDALASDGDPMGPSPERAFAAPAVGPRAAIAASRTPVRAEAPAAAAPQPAARPAVEPVVAPGAPRGLAATDGLRSRS